VTVEQQPIGAGVAETVERDGAFPRLDDGQMQRFRGLGRVREVERGEVLFAAGDEHSDFFIVESGAVTIVQGYGEENRVIAVHKERRFLGELGMLVGQRLYLTGVVRDPGEVIQVPLEKLKEIVAEDKALSDMILGAFMARRAILIGLGTGLKLIGSRFSHGARERR
jgi:thioredoxin reductase (NADPH)